MSKRAVFFLSVSLNISTANQLTTQYIRYELKYFNSACNATDPTVTNSEVVKDFPTTCDTGCERAKTLTRV